MRYLPSLPYIQHTFALFCTKFALSKFDVNQIFRAVYVYFFLLEDQSE